MIAQALGLGRVRCAAESSISSSPMFSGVSMPSTAPCSP